MRVGHKRSVGVQLGGLHRSPDLRHCRRYLVALEPDLPQLRADLQSLPWQLQRNLTIVHSCSFAEGLSHIQSGPAAPYLLVMSMTASPTATVNLVELLRTVEHPEVLRSVWTGVGAEIADGWAVLFLVLTSVPDADVYINPAARGTQGVLEALFVLQGMLTTAAAKTCIADF